VRGISLLFAIIALMALAGYILRRTSRVASNVLYILAAIFLALLVLGLARVT
jgi:hypothetical protein